MTSTIENAERLVELEDEMRKFTSGSVPGYTGWVIAYETALKTHAPAIAQAYLEAVKALGEARKWLPTRTSPAAQQFPEIGELHAKIDSIIGPEVKG